MQTPLSVPIKSSITEDQVEEEVKSDGSKDVVMEDEDDDDDDDIIWEVMIDEWWLEV